MNTIASCLLTVLTAATGVALTANVSAQPAAQLDQGAASGRGTGSGSYGALVSTGGSSSAVQLVSLPEVQQDLALTDAQKGAVQAITQRLHTFEMKVFEEGKNPPPSRRAEWHTVRQVAAQREVAKASQELAQVLTGAQVQRLGEIALQDQGAEALFQPEVIKALGLSQAQQQNLARIQNEANQQIAAALGLPRGPARVPPVPGGIGTPQARASAGGGTAAAGAGAGSTSNTGLSEIIRASERKMLEEVLTPPQQAKLKELQGEPCPLKPRFKVRTGGGGGGFTSSGQGGEPLR